MPKSRDSLGKSLPTTSADEGALLESSAESRGFGPSAGFNEHFAGMITLHALETPHRGQQGYGPTMTQNGLLNAGLLLHQGGRERMTIFLSLVGEQPPGPYMVDRTCGGMMASSMPARFGEESTFLFRVGSPACRPPSGLPPGCPPPARLAARPGCLPACLSACLALLAFVVKDCFGFFKRSTARWSF